MCELARAAVRTRKLPRGVGLRLLVLGHRPGSIRAFAGDEHEREIQAGNSGLIPRLHLPSARPRVCARVWASACARSRKLSWERLWSKA